MKNLMDGLFIINSLEYNTKYDMYIVEYTSEGASIPISYEFFVKKSQVPSRIPQQGTLSYLKEVYGLDTKKGGK